MLFEHGIGQSQLVLQTEVFWLLTSDNAWYKMEMA